MHLVPRESAPGVKTDGRVVILEMVPNPDRVTPAVPARFSLTMLGGTPAGDAYTLDELGISSRKPALPTFHRIRCRRRKRSSSRARLRKQHVRRAGRGTERTNRRIVTRTASGPRHVAGMTRWHRRSLARR